MPRTVPPTPGSSFEGTLTGGSHAASDKYLERRAWIGEYFDRTAAAGWKALTSDEKVSRVRATVRAGRDTMRHTLLSFLPEDLAGWRILDAGCGTGMLAVDLALRGASVVAVDLSPTLMGYGRERAEAAGVADRIAFHAGDMLDPAYGEVDAVVAMDSIIHYDLAAQDRGARRPCAAHARAPSFTPWLRGRRSWVRCSRWGGSFPSATAPRGSCRRRNAACAPRSRRRRRWPVGAVAGRSVWNAGSTARRRTN